MSKHNRNRRAAGVARAQKYVSVADQKIRATERAEGHLRRYPHPPRYRYSYAENPPEQPACYTRQDLACVNPTG